MQHEYGQSRRGASSDSGVYSCLSAASMSGMVPFIIHSFTCFSAHHLLWLKQFLLGYYGVRQVRNVSPSSYNILDIDHQHQHSYGNKNDSNYNVKERSTYKQYKSQNNKERMSWRNIILKEEDELCANFSRMYKRNKNQGRNINKVFLTNIDSLYNFYINCSLQLQAHCLEKTENLKLKVI